MVTAMTYNDSELVKKVYLKFRKGRQITYKEAKEILQKIYDDIGITYKAQVKHLDNLIPVKHKKIRGERWVEFI